MLPLYLIFSFEVNLPFSLALKPLAILDLDLQDRETVPDQCALTVAISTLLKLKPSPKLVKLEIW